MISRLLKAASVAALLSTSAFAADTDWNERFKEILGKSITFHTAEGHGQVPAYAAYLADQLKAGGFAAEDIHILPHGETAALVVRYRGDGSAAKKPILLAAHMDVVEAKREDWERDPFTMVEENGYLFGRGIVDNKFGVTLLVTTFLRLKAEGYVPNRDLVIAFSGDEESSMVTTKAIANDHRDLTDAEFVLNADAGGGTIGEDGKVLSYSLQAAEKTYATFHLTVTDPGGHSSRPTGSNAIYRLAKALTAIENYSFPVNTNDITLGFFKAQGPLTGGELGAAMTAFAKDPSDKKAVATLRKQASYVGVTGTTCVATMLTGGHAENALPQSATATVNCRIFPGEGVALTQERLQKAVNDDRVVFTQRGESTESPASPLRDDIMTAVTDAVHANFPGLPIIPAMSPGATDGMHYRAAGMPTYGVEAIYMKNSDGFSHGLNERVPVATIPVAIDQMYRVLTTLTK
ncbi:M20/M25/M40 family metallo-hydrolase [Pseudokordiimonas caeni]|uniref:M20/M25/M40 family metallo-hydrolase n=1 Tax=Pseudokordiimonas caeni TaxID=2997908 RepID=UPI0028119407|nr:M20/M25/M40 family metallo-hydrolase [Pseudokordiimonas caeni]